MTNIKEYLAGIRPGSARQDYFERRAADATGLPDRVREML
jgi:hypothetical protein